MADFGAELGKAREGMPRRRLPGSKPGSLFRIQPFEAGCLGIRHVTVVNLAICGMEADFRPEHADTFRRDFHPAPSPFSDPSFFRKDDDVRWRKSGNRICIL